MRAIVRCASEDRSRVAFVAQLLFFQGLRHGLTRVEVDEVVNHLSLYACIPRAVEAMRAVREAFAKLDAG